MIALDAKQGLNHDAQEFESALYQKSLSYCDFEDAISREGFALCDLN
jgi:hypothetical protein